MIYTIREAIAALGGELVKGKTDTKVTGVSTDTRTIKPGDLFFALISENSDGHRFAAAAVEKGASGVVVSQDVDAEGTVIRVPDTLVALGDLAAWYRRQFNVRAVGITGSVGKTSTKEMIAAVLGRRFNVLKNAGNFNNEIGAPLTIFQLQPEHDILVQEMAMRLPGEITELAEIVRPDIGVITNIGISHIERLGSRDAIAAAKSELLEALPMEGIAVLNADDPYFEFLSGKVPCNVTSYGVKAGDVRAENVKMDADGRPRFTVVVGEASFDVALPVIGEHNVLNALAAVAVGLCFGVSKEEIAAGLESLSSTEKRANVIECSGGYKVIDDSYNASPASMTGALKTLAVMDGARKIAVLGDMKELGDHAEAAHTEVGKVAAESGLSMLVTVGELAKNISSGAKSAGFTGDILEFYTSDEAAAGLKGVIKAGDVVLVKASRSMETEKIVEALK
ncbi:MAG: UDP-N-acetylmuramoyl-tripeptide--D-alanyl-D-alanine ligase [Armatimonadota bacterium]